MEVEIIFQDGEDRKRLNYFCTNIERLNNYFIRHKKVLKDNIEIQKLELLLGRKSDTFCITPRYLGNLNIDKIDTNLIRFYLDVKPFVDFNINIWLDSENKVGRFEVEYFDEYFFINYFKMKLIIRPPIKQIKKRYSWFNK